jgi:hypothetical protein
MVRIVVTGYVNIGDRNGMEAQFETIERARETMAKALQDDPELEGGETDVQVTLGWEYGKSHPAKWGRKASRIEPMTTAEVRR